MSLSRKSLFCSALLSILLVACTPKNEHHVTKTVAANSTTTIGRSFSINPDCTVRAQPKTRIVQPPEHGKLAIIPIQDYPAYSMFNQRAVCNKTKVPGEAMQYTPDMNFVGTDHAYIQIFAEGGQEMEGEITINVK